MPGLSTWWALDIRELAPHAQTDTVVAVGADLQRRLGQPHRHYHTATHLVEMFWALEELEQAGEINAREGTLARVAAWFHDAVYDVDDPANNERRSADLALGSLDALGLPAPDMDAVERLILDTAQHLLPQGDALAAAFHDADLWILAAPAERFDAYCAQVRQEYAVVPAEAYAAARAAALEPFTQRDTIYATRTGRQRWEEPAHENLARELHRLRAETPR